jgi:hypothetical protein
MSVFRQVLSQMNHLLYPTNRRHHGPVDGQQIMGESRDCRNFGLSKTFIKCQHIHLSFTPIIKPLDPQGSLLRSIEIVNKLIIITLKSKNLHDSVGISVKITY